MTVACIVKSMNFLYTALSYINFKKYRTITVMYELFLSDIKLTILLRSLHFAAATRKTNRFENYFFHDITYGNYLDKVFHITIAMPALVV